jgi:hypothetical protein
VKKTLVIHPKDESTDFLSVIYKDIPNCKVMTGGKLKEVNEHIYTHDRIIMLGHGSSNGLMSVNKFNNNGYSLGYVINRDTVPLLREKECIFIWCNANVFVEHNKLNGFYTGMFISEVNESIYCRCDSSQDDVDKSNEFFSSLLSECINNDLNFIFEYVKQFYGKICSTNKVAFYNHQRLYLQN